MLLQRSHEFTVPHSLQGNEQCDQPWGEYRAERWFLQRLLLEVFEPEVILEPTAAHGTGRRRGPGGAEDAPCPPCPSPTSRDSSGQHTSLPAPCSSPPLTQVTADNPLHVASSQEGSDLGWCAHSHLPPRGPPRRSRCWDRPNGTGFYGGQPVPHLRGGGRFQLKLLARRHETWGCGARAGRCAQGAGAADGNVPGTREGCGF